MAAEPIVHTSTGAVRGVPGAGLATFHAIAYAAPPLGELRFAAPRPHAPWAGVRDCTEPGACPPQGPSRLDAVIGAAAFAQSEDCLTLTVWTPAADRARRPVLVWLHGGAFQAGGAHQAHYDGGTLARAGDIVVVGVGYRLGALGYLYLPEAQAHGGVAANRGLLDQMQALRWVHDNIAAFGGDPAAITVCGQSAGGGSVLALLQDPASRKLVARAIAQSPSTSVLTVERASEIAASLHDKAGVPRGDFLSLRALPWQQLLAAQRAVQADIAATGDRTLAYQNVAPQPSCPLNPASAVADGIARDVPILIGTTLDEGHAWIGQDPALVAQTDLRVIAAAAQEAGLAKAAADLPPGRRTPGQQPWQLLSAMLTWAAFEKPSRRVATGHARHGGTAHVYRFDWRPTRDAFWGACHCIEIPFMLDNLAHWPDAAMLRDHDPASCRALATRMRRAWVGFVRTGDPSTPDLPAWPRWSADQRACMVLDDEPKVLRE